MSYHMLPCSAPYLQASVDCSCDVADGAEPSVVWYSSVHQNKRMQASDVNAEYWNNNLVSPVRFMQAVEAAAIEHKSLDAAIEVGCHPALKAPCSQPSRRSSLANCLTPAACNAVPAM
ncbi:hypothetical protein J3E71DRAFT_238900 [Bipolaris maydis]|nr:hypothetical protein J3E71DRAFT_238900 [Bipolaris maydis]